MTNCNYIEEYILLIYRFNDMIIVVFDIIIISVVELVSVSKSMQYLYPTNWFINFCCAEIVQIII